MSKRKSNLLKAASVRLDSKSSFDDAVSAIIASSLAQFVVNWASLRKTDNPESIHQMRVALRRLRSGIVMFKQVAPAATFVRLRQGAKQITSVLEPAREFDVFCESIRQGPLPQATPAAICDPLLAVLENHRTAAYSQARLHIEAIETIVFVLGVIIFLARKDWQTAVTGRKLQMPARKFAKSALEKLHADVLKRGKRLPRLSDDARHELRIALKKLRYATEFYGKLFDRSKRRKSMIEKASALQDILGAHNDLVSLKRFVEVNKLARDPALAASSEFILAWYAKQSSAADKSLHQAWKKFKHAKTFWS